ncbi:MAG: DUF5658 family protein [Planctomycetota bacterium]
MNSGEEGRVGETGWLSMPAMLFPNGYVWFVFVSSLDIMMTWAILTKRNGVEVNPVARMVIEEWGLTGAIVFKFSLMLFVILICEIVGRARYATGRRLVIAAVGISSFPPAWSLLLLTWHAWSEGVG